MMNEEERVAHLSGGGQRHFYRTLPGFRWNDGVLGVAIRLEWAWCPWVGGTWIPAFAGKTVGVRAAIRLVVAGLFLVVGVAWFPAFAGMTGGVGVAVRLVLPGGSWELGLRGFRLSPE